MNTINLEQKFSLFEEQWTPKILAELNGQQIKIAKLENNFVWHAHEHEDELFFVIKGKLIMEFRDKTEIIHAGEMIVVPRGVEHNPRTEEGEEVWVMLFEPKAIKHTGEVEHEKTQHHLEWL